ncbi:MAG: hypothetical protein ACXADH_04950 [Candidatus Kariarchaeaceae archaeon]|jgi:hypothetical protein
MDNDSKIPDTWAMPDDLAKKVSETLNKKRITPEDELADALEELARDIALIEPDPRDWGGWVIYLLEQMEVEAKRRMKSGNFEEMIEKLISDLSNPLI